MPIARRGGAGGDPRRPQHRLPRAGDPHRAPHRDQRGHRTSAIPSRPRIPRGHRSRARGRATSRPRRASASSAPSRTAAPGPHRRRACANGALRARSRHRGDAEDAARQRRQAASPDRARGRTGASHRPCRGLRGGRSCDRQPDVHGLYERAYPRVRSSRSVPAPKIDKGPVSQALPPTQERED